MKKIFLIIIFLFFLGLFSKDTYCATRTYDGAAVIKQTSSSGQLMVTVLPVVNPDDNEKGNVVITKAIISQLLDSGFIDVVPYRLMIEHVWQFYPGFFEVNPSKVSINPNNIDFFGTLELVEKNRLAPTIGCDFIIDGIYSPETEKVIICELFSSKENKIVVSFSEEINDSGLDAVKNICRKISTYFFEQSADDLVFQEVRKLAVQQVSGKPVIQILEKWDSLYPDNLFVSSGMMIYYKKQSYSPDKLVSAGEKWFSKHDENISKQIRFFKSLNFNPYYVLGNEYIKQQEYEKALEVLRKGEKTFPFNSNELKDELILCLRLLGKHEEAEFIEEKK